MGKFQKAIIKNLIHFLEFFDQYTWSIQKSKLNDYQLQRYQNSQVFQAVLKLSIC